MAADLVLTCVGDVHFRIRNGIPKNWQIRRYHAFIQAVVRRCSSNGTPLVLLGDQLDDVQLRPDELRLLLLLLWECRDNKIDVFLVSGNHETLKENDSVLDYLLPKHLFSNIFYRERVMDYKGSGVNIQLLNHDSIRDERDTPLPTEGFNLLCTHVRCDVNKFITAEADLWKILEGYDACVAGDIHSAMASPEGIIYTNNPLNNEFEPDPQTGFLELSITKGGSYSINRVATDFAKLIRIDCDVDGWPDAIKRMDDSPKHFYSVRITGTPDELRTIDNKPDNCRIEKKPTVSVLLEASADMDSLSTNSDADWSEATGEYLKAVDVTEARKTELLHYDKEHLC